MGSVAVSQFLGSWVNLELFELPFHPTYQKHAFRWIDNGKMPLGVNFGIVS